MSLEELFRRARDRAQGEVATSVFGLQHGTRLQVSVETAQTRVLLVRSGTAFGACTVADDRLGDAGRAELCGKELVELFDHPLPEVRVAALDAHLGARRGWDEPQARVVELAAGTPEQRAAGRDAVVAELLGTEPGRTILLVGVVDPLVAAIRDRGCRPLLCDLAVTRTASGDPVVREVAEVLPQADAVLATGMTLGNGTFDDLAARCRAQGVPLALYAQTGSAIARELVDEGVLDAACSSRSRSPTTPRPRPGSICTERAGDPAAIAPVGESRRGRCSTTSRDMPTMAEYDAHHDLGSLSMSVPTEVPVAPVPDGVMARRIWPILTASAVSLLPFTLLSVFLVDIAADSGESTAVIGSLRGLGGVAALVVGVLVVGVIDRFPRHRTSAVALVLLAASTLLATLGTATTLSLFCWGVGAAMAVLNPTLGALAGDHWDDPINSARAATLVSATQSSTALMAAPLVALPSLFWGWRGTLVAVTVIALAVALLLSRRPAPAVPAQTEGSRFRAYGTLLVRPLIAALVSISLIRTTVFMGWLAHVAAMYQQRFDLSAFWFSLVWTMSGGAFFLGNLLTGRMLARHSAPRAVAGVLVGGCLAGAVGLTLLLVPAPLPVAIAGTVVLAAGHASVAAAVTTLLVREAGTMRGTALALNAVAQSLGIFFGATAVGAALVAGGWAGVGLLLAVLTGVAAVLSLAVWGRSGR